MTSPDAKKLWRRAVKEHFNCTCVYCGNNYELHQEKGSSNWLGWMRATFGTIPDREQMILTHIS